MSTALTPELRAFLEDVRGDVRRRIDGLLGEIRGIAGAQKVQAIDVLELKARAEKLETFATWATDQIHTIKRGSFESRAEFDASATGLSRILFDQNTAADERFRKIEKALKDDARVQMLAIAMVVVAGVLLGTDRIDFPQFMIATGSTGATATAVLRYLDSQRKKAGS
jgi:hypothetical protein